MSWFKSAERYTFVRGEVAERFKAHAWKACVGLPLPRVRIPPSPPLEKTTVSYLEAWLATAAAAFFAASGSPK